MPTSEQERYQGLERRRAPRVDVDFPLEIKSGEGVIEVRVRNLSISGAYCTSSSPIPVNTKLGVLLEIPRRRGKEGKKSVVRVACHGIVVRSRPEAGDGLKPRYGMAIFFYDISERDQGELFHYVKEHVSAEEMKLLERREKHSWEL